MGSQYLTFDELSEEQQELLLAAAKVRENAYAPYSKFHVGAAIRAKDGILYTGANVENAAFGSTMCAERVAIYSAVKEGVREFDSLAVIASGEDIVTPCGACRQVINEFADYSGGLKIIMSNNDMTQIEVSTLDTLLPRSFGPKNLGMDVSQY